VWSERPAARTFLVPLSMHDVSIRQQEGTAVVLASGELDAYAAPDLVAAFAAVAGSQSVVADLTRVSFLDSTALGEIVRAARAREELGAGLRIVLPEGPARRIFEMTQLDRALPVADTLTGAIGDLAS
jgi:anti-sigma B factor antagonist